MKLNGLKEIGAGQVGMKTKHIGILVKGMDKYGFILYLLSLVPFHKGATFLKVATPCGDVVYKTMKDIPNESVPCPCGDKNHWMIKYES